MKVKILIGIILVLSSIFYGCTKLDDPCFGYKYKTFGLPETKATVNITWSKGDQVCVYSLDEYNTILHKDTVEVTNILGSSGKITALVAKNSKQYFATYPKDAIKSEIGETLNDSDFRIHLTGSLGDVSVMTCYADTSASILYFKNRFALAKITNVSKNSIITVESFFPSSTTVTTKFNEYYVPLTFINEKIKLTLKTGVLVKTWENHNKAVNPDTIYNIKQ